MFYNPYTNSQYGEVSVPNPQAPFDGEIPGGLQAGQRTIIRGYIPGHSQRFRIDYVTYSGHIALHMNPRFDQNSFVRNTDSNGWGEEERSGPFPFRKSQPFELVASIDNTGFNVDVNGQHIFSYRHRVPFSEVNRLIINGDVEVHSISFQGGQARTNEVHNPQVPGAVALVGGCFPGKLIQIHGFVPHHANRFAINLQGSRNNEPENIALHFNPRWDDPHQGSAIVRTHRHYGNWGSEDRHLPSFPFHKGSNFEMLILNDNSEWKVAVNGNHFVSYPQHFECGLVDHIAFAGDVVIQSVRQFN